MFTFTDRVFPVQLTWRGLHRSDLPERRLGATFRMSDITGQSVPIFRVW